jgi:anti-sigma B factor antagonist
VTDPDGPPDLLVTRSQPRPGVRVLRPAGVLDLRTAPVLARFLREQAADHPGGLVLDLAGVRLLAAAGVALVITAHRELRGRLHVTGVHGNPAVERVLEITGTRAQLDVHDDDLDALLDRLDPG